MTLNICGWLNAGRWYNWNYYSGKPLLTVLDLVIKSTVYQRNFKLEFHCIITNLPPRISSEPYSNKVSKAHSDSQMDTTYIHIFWSRILFLIILKNVHRNFIKQNVYLIKGYSYNIEAQTMKEFSDNIGLHISCKNCKFHIILPKQILHKVSKIL